MSVFKKKIAFVFTFFILVLNIFANSKNIVAIITEVNDDEKWLGDLVTEKLESNLLKYTDFIFVNNENKEKIYEFQRESESAAYDPKTAIELEKLLGANHYILVKIINNGTGYSVSAHFVDLTQGNEVTVSPILRDNADDLYGFPGCAADELTISLCDALGVKLTPTDKACIMNGEKGLTGDAKLAMYREVEQRYLSNIENLDNQLNILKDDTDADAIVRQENLAGEREIALRELESLRKKKDRMIKEQNKRNEDNIKNAERSEAQLERISKKSRDLSKKTEYIESRHKTRPTLMSQIRAVEIKKRALVEFENEIEATKNEMRAQADSEIESKMTEIFERPLRNTEKVDGEMTDQAYENRMKEVDEYKAILYDDLEKEFINFDKTKESQRAIKIKEINKGYASCMKNTITSLDDELIVEFGDYDGERFGWNAYVTVQSDNFVIFQTKTFISYHELTGKNPVTDFKDSHYADYNDDVDFYVSMFDCGEPLLTFALDVVITPLDKQFPSKYLFEFSNLRVYDTLKLKVKDYSVSSHSKKEFELDETSVVRQMEPAYDIRSEADFEELENLRRKEEEKANKLAEKQLKKEIAKENWNPNRSLIGISVGGLLTGMTGSVANIELSYGLLPIIYLDWKTSLLNPNFGHSEYYVVDNTEFNPVLATTAQIGLNIPFGSVFQVFGAAGVGGNFYIPMNIYNTTDPEKIANYEKNVKLEYTYGFSIGMSVELFRHFALSGCYDFTFMFDNNYKYEDINFGIAFVF